MRKVIAKRFVVYFDYVRGEMMETVECNNRKLIRNILQKKYGLSVKIRRVELEL